MLLCALARHWGRGSGCATQRLEFARGAFGKDHVSVTFSVNYQAVKCFVAVHGLMA